MTAIVIGHLIVGLLFVLAALLLVHGALYPQRLVTVALAAALGLIIFCIAVSELVVWVLWRLLA
jgi:hypothetical protein